MVRLGAIFVAICMVLISGSFGAVLYLWFGLTGAESSLVGLASLTALALYNTVSTRLHDRGDFGAHIADLSRGTADLARQVAELGRRLAAVEASTTGAVDRAVAATKPLALEIGELGTLVKQLAETVAAHETALHGPSVTREQPAAAPPMPSLRAETGTAPARDGTAGHAGRFTGMERDAVLTILREAIESNRIDLHLQPIVTLPQRKVRFYEALARLRSGDGELLIPTDFLPFAEADGLMPKLDNAILLRCVQVLRRLLAKNRDVGLFCNISPATLGDPHFFPQLNEFLEANRALAPALVFELTQAAYRSLGPIEIESLGALSDGGFRFSMDHVADLRLEPRDLGERGFRFVKVPAALLLSRAGPAASDIYPADFAGLLSRFGIEMIAERIESEGAVVDLLDYDVKYGQGFLFSPPRPVRPEVMQGIADRVEAMARGAGAEPVDTARSGAAMRPAAGGKPMPAAADVRPAAVQRASALAQLARGVVARS